MVGARAAGLSVPFLTGWIVLSVVALRFSFVFTKQIIKEKMTTLSPLVSIGGLLSWASLIAMPWLVAYVVPRSDPIVMKQDDAPFGDEIMAHMGAFSANEETKWVLPAAATLVCLVILLPNVYP